VMDEYVRVSVELLTAVHDALAVVLDHEPVHWVESKIEPLRRLGVVLEQVRAQRRVEEDPYPVRDPEDPCRRHPDCLRTSRCPYDPVCNN
jgi:hypothetical protein